MPLSKSRRVPDQLRKRAAVSCDFCKVRRRKCVRTTPQGSCKLCLEHNLDCISTTRRRSLNPVERDENSSRVLHHRALEDLFAKLFPGVATDNTEAIVSLSREVDNGTVVVTRNTSQSTSRPSILRASHSTWNFTSSDNTIELQDVISPAEKQPTTTSYECMLQSPSGTLSYFGSSSSMAYVHKIRDLLAALTTNVDISLNPKESLRRTFIKDQYARTMGGESPGSIPEVPEIGYIQIDALQSSEQDKSRLCKLLKDLPSKEETDEFVELFFDHVHINIALFHRLSFQAVLDRLRVPETPGIDVGWAVCLRLAVSFGCEWRLSTLEQGNNSEWERLSSLKRKLLHESFADISHLMLSGTLQSITAFALFSVYMSFANERNAAWILSGCAIRMAIGLGLHRGENVVHHSAGYRSPLEKELRKQIWCSLYIYEQYTSALFGRPSAVDGVESIIDLPKESVLNQGFHWPPGYLQHDVLLARIISKIREAQTDQSLCLSNDLDGLPDVKLCHELLEKLDEWRNGIPSFLEFDEENLDKIYPSHLRQILMIHVRYQYARIMLSRPFLLKALYISHGLKAGHTVNSPILKFKDICLQAALESWALIRCLWERGQYNANLWLDGVFAYQCNLILSLFLLDSSKTSDFSQANKIQYIIKQIQGILHKGPSNRTMRRLVQISRDFSEIVSSAPFSVLAREPEASAVDEGPSQAQFASNSNTFAEMFPQSSDYWAIDWGNNLDTDIFQGDFASGSFTFNSLFDISFDRTNSQT